MSKTPKPVAVYGALRSGTTVFRLMLNNNSQLNCPGEVDFLFDYQLPPNNMDANYDIASLKRDRIFRNHLPDFVSAPDNEITLQNMTDALAKRKRGTESKLVLIAHRNLDKMLECLPDIKIVHLVRDPRDVARSSIGMGWAASTYYGIGHWLGTENDWAKRAKNLPDRQVLQVQYEQLIKDPTETLKEVCEFLEVEYEPEMLEYGDSSTYSKPDASLIYQWKHKQTPNEIGLVEAQIGTLLSDLGYEPSGHPQIHPGSMKRLQLVIQHKWVVWEHRIRRYGFRDSFIVAVARRLGKPELGASAQFRIDEKAKSYLK